MVKKIETVRRNNVYNDINRYLPEMISEGKKRRNESLNEDTLYKSVLKKLMPGVATSEIYDQPNLGYVFDIDPDYETIDKVASRLLSQGFTQVDSYESQMYGEDSYEVFINEINGSRVVCGIVYQEDDFAFVNARYDEEEDQDYFE